MIDPVTKNTVSDYISPTFNLATMFYQAMGLTMAELHGVKGIEAIRHIRLGLARLDRDPEYYKQFNAKNGWGTYENAIEALQYMQVLCCDHPNDILEIY